MPLYGHIVFIAMIVLFAFLTWASFFTNYPHKLWETQKYFAPEPDEKSFITDTKIGFILCLLFFLTVYIAGVIKTCGT